MFKTNKLYSCKYFITADTVDPEEAGNILLESLLKAN